MYRWSDHEANPDIIFFMPESIGDPIMKWTSWTWLDFLYHQVISCVHPYKKERSLEELLTEELEYYTLFLANDYKTEEHSRSSEIPLESFFEFPRVSKLTNDIGVLR